MPHDVGCNDDRIIQAQRACSACMWGDCCSVTLSSTIVIRKPQYILLYSLVHMMLSHRMMNGVALAILVLLFDSCCNAFQLNSKPIQRWSGTLSPSVVPVHVGGFVASAYRRDHRHGAAASGAVTGLTRSLVTQLNNKRPDLTADKIATKQEPLLEPNPLKLVYGVAWLLFVGYAYLLSPGGSAESAAADSALIQKMITAPFDGTSNAFFVAIFNFLGIIPAVYASLLLPGSRGQKVPALPFVIGSFALGFFGLGPYLGLRELNYQPSESESKGIFESKLPAVGMLAFFTYLVYTAVTTANESSLSGFLELFATQRLVHVSSLDFIILSLFMADPLFEDMKRRNFSSPIPSVFFCFPVLGPVIYLLVRPPIK